MKVELFILILGIYKCLADTELRHHVELKHHDDLRHHDELRHHEELGTNAEILKKHPKNLDEINGKSFTISPKKIDLSKPYPYRMQAFKPGSDISNTYQGETYGNIYIINHPGYGNDIVIHNYPAGSNPSNVVQSKPTKYEHCLSELSMSKSTILFVEMPKMGTKMV